MMLLPEISEEEFKEYMNLKRKEKERQQQIDSLLEHGIGITKKWRKDLNTYRGHASIFANLLQKEYERRGNPSTFVLDRWRVVKDYLTPKLIWYDKSKKKQILNRHFRRYLKEYGWSVRIRNGLFEVTKIL